MREKIQQQRPLVPVLINHPHARELEKMNSVLDQLAQAADLVHADLVGRSQSHKGRRGMAAEQVLRAMLLKQMNGFSYAELAFHLADSASYRWFCRIGIGDKAPTRSRLQKNIKRVRAETWQSINRMLVRYAAEQGVERGHKVRTDSTVVETNIHYPTDSSLLWDCVRVLGRLLAQARDSFGLSFTDHRRRAKRRARAIAQAASAAERSPLYRDLIKVSDKMVHAAQRVACELERVEVGSFAQALQLQAIAAELLRVSGLAERVISQAERRVLRGEQVAATEKLVSVFEPHTDIIVKDHREALYGHKVYLTSGASGMVTDVLVERGNPADSSLAVTMVERHCSVFGKPPRQVSFDGGFASRDNLRQIKARGVQDVAFAKKCGLQIADMVKSTWVYRRLRDFRAGVEGIISFLKRAFGLERCRWSGFASFRAYVAGSVLACNLLVLARLLLSR